MSYSQAPVLHWFEAFYRTGSLIFGGGQVGCRKAGRPFNVSPGRTQSFSAHPGAKIILKLAWRARLYEPERLELLQPLETQSPPPGVTGSAAFHHR